MMAVTLPSPTVTHIVNTGVDNRVLSLLWGVQYAILQLGSIRVPQYTTMTNWIENALLMLPERVRRLLSHFGGIGELDVDYTNVIYRLVWFLILEEVPSTWYMQTVSSLKNAGNTLEAIMGIDWLDSKLSTREEWADLMRARSLTCFTKQEWHKGYDFVKDVQSSNIMNAIHQYDALLQKVIMSVHTVVRGINPGGIFQNLYNKLMTYEVLVENLDHFEAIRLGWASAFYARQHKGLDGRYILEINPAQAAHVEQWACAHHAWRLVDCKESYCPVFPRQNE